MPLPPTSTHDRPLTVLFLAAFMALHATLPMHAAPSDVSLSTSLPTHTTQSDVDFGRKVKVPTPAVKSFTILPPFGTTVSTSATTSTTVPARQPAADSQDAARAMATAYLTDTLGFPAFEFVIKNVVTTSSGVTVVYARQVVNGLEVINADVNMNVKNGQIIAFGDSFYRGARPLQPDLAALSDAESTTGRSPADGLMALAAFVGAPTPTTVSVTVPAPTAVGDTSPAPLFEITSEIATAPVPVRYAYVQNGNNLKLVYSFQLKQTLHWYHGHVNVQTGEIEAVNDWAAVARYPVIPVGEKSPDMGPLVIVDSAAVILPNASPRGWQDNTVQQFTTTQGNAVDVRPKTRDDSKNVPPDGGPDLDFTKFAPIFATADPNDFAAGSAVEMFYLMNIAHDLTYQYGFDEASGNFQDDNYNKGGLGSDHVDVQVQAANGINSETFVTPPDGQRPFAAAYLYTYTTSQRDSVFDLVVPHHEYFHGVSNRLTGGPSNSDCLSTREAQGMGEGWSDMFALAVNVLDKQTATRNVATPFAPYVAGNPTGLRTFPYTSDLTVNPSRYSFLGTKPYRDAHKIGEVWASMLWEVYWNLVDKYGCGPIERANLTDGNALWLQIIMDGLKLQPCQPSFIDARDAILLAELLLTRGVNNCLIWRGFAKRGLGYTATAGVYVDSFTAPPQCAQ